MQRRRHQRFARTGGGVEDDVLLVEQFQDGRFLRGIKLEPPARHIFEKTSQQHIVADFLVARNQIVKCRCHGTRTLRIIGAPEKEDEQWLIRAGTGGFDLRNPREMPRAQFPAAEFNH